MHTHRSIIISYAACGIVGLCIIAAMFLVPSFLVNYYKEQRGDILLCFYPCSVLGLAALASLVFLLKNIMAGEIFCRPNVRLLWIISNCCFTVAVITLAGGFFWLPYFAIAAAAGFMGLILRIVKNVMQKGTEIREENDLTV